MIATKLICFLVWLICVHELWLTNEYAGYAAVILTVWAFIPQRIIDRLI